MYTEYSKTTDTAGPTIAELATLENALIWENIDDAFTFCTDLMEVSAHCNSTFRNVELLEERFCKLLASV